MLARISSKLRNLLSTYRARRIARDVATKAEPQGPAVVFFNSSARMGFISQNAAFSILSAWGLRLAGVRIVHFICSSGMRRCVLGTNALDPNEEPECNECIALSRHLYADAETRWFGFEERAEIGADIQGMDLAQLTEYSYQDWPLGQLVLPSLRWALRRHHLEDDKQTRIFFRQYILSAYNVAQEFEQMLDAVQPKAVVLFNGIMFPEATAALAARRRGLRTITHEVGLRPFTAFFTEGEATAYPMDIPPDFQLDAAQNAQLDEYLGNRFQGRFSMAGVQFWPQMQELGDAFLSKAAQFKHIVPIFTNVIFDTSQVHANTRFAHMFAWLDALLPIIRQHQDTLFVIRAHPDEMRPNSNKKSRESVAEWVQANRVAELPNVIFVDATEYLSSYALIQRSHFVMVYNSSIGLEASILGKPVLSAGAARYTQYKTVFYPASADEYLGQVNQFLAAESLTQPAEMVSEARRVLYYQLYRTALPFGDFLYPHATKGLVHFKDFPTEALQPENSAAVQAVFDGVINDKPFLV
ncbi:MAG: hypothetical protein KIT46_04895 [Anaerolineales bacterium]|nr:hypothetical protein [Anaerolineales bacterium]MCW5855369.1 hypothetical protein [Anaerolineales bacterium]